MKTKRFFMLALACGLVACGATVDLERDEGRGTQDSYTDSAIVGPVDGISAAQLSATEAERAKAVGYLEVPGPGIRCTAWLASKDIVITTHHCIDSALRAEGARVSFNFNDGVSTEQTVWYDCSQFVRTWEDLDMTALRCAAGSDGKRPGEVYGYDSGVRAGRMSEALRDLEIGCPVYQGETCYWMGFHDTGNWSGWCWVPATWASDFRACYEMDSCSGGLGTSGGGCYKWAMSSEAPRTPW